MRRWRTPSAGYGPGIGSGNERERDLTRAAAIWEIASHFLTIIGKACRLLLFGESGKRARVGTQPGASLRQRIGMLPTMLTLMRPRKYVQQRDRGHDGSPAQLSCLPQNMTFLLGWASTNPRASYLGIIPGSGFENLNSWQPRAVPYMAASSWMMSSILPFSGWPAIGEPCKARMVKFCRRREGAPNASPQRCNPLQIATSNRRWRLGLRAFIVARQSHFAHSLSGGKCGIHCSSQTSSAELFIKVKWILGQAGIIWGIFSRAASKVAARIALYG